MRRSSSLSLASALLCGSLAALTPLAASSQEEAPEPAEEAAPPPLPAVEEIVITTQRREQSLQDVGISVTALSGDELEKLGISTSVDIAAQTPNLKVGLPAGEGNIPAIFLRGVGLNDFNQNANGSVGWYVDDVYISQVSAQVFPLFDLERVEVARGPQGTLYGRNTTGGLVNFVSRRPSHEEADGEFSASYGTWNRLELRGAGGGPITDTLAGRVALVYGDADGWIDNDLPGRGDTNDRNYWAGRGQLSFRPNESLSVLLNVHGGQNRAHAPQYEHQGLLPCGPGLPSRCDALGYTDPTGIEDGSYNLNGSFDIDTWGGLLEIEGDVGEVTLTSLTAYV
jgi:iron complex outermembrane receptor protein